MPIAPGSKLGPYEVLALIGAGGMGEVYRARDTRLGRDVALKILRADRHGDEAGRRRFEQEARTASALNHPNIATLHDFASADGIDFIVMEYVDGRPLSALLRGKLSVADAIRLAIPIADALARAHTAGIIHRDLKPANIVVANDGTVKVLDFGIAKLVERPAAGGDQETVTERTTSSAIRQPAAFDGTPGYVSPEQAAGERVDARSDIFSFGALLYEMVTGRRAFQGSSPAETIAQVMRDQPRPPSEITPGVPRDLERLILRCLRKERERRVQFMADVKVELQEIAEAPGVPQTAQRPPVHDRRLAWTAGAVLIALAIAATALFVWRGREIARPHPRVVPLTVTRGIEASPNFSPDGRQLAFAWDGEPAAAGVPTNFDLWLKLPGGSEARRLTSDAADDMGPSWSPDGRQIAFQRGRAGFPGTILSRVATWRRRAQADRPARRPVRDQLVSRGGRAAARVVSRRTMAGRGAGEGAGRDPPRRGRHPPRSGWRRRAATAHRPGSSRRRLRSRVLVRRPPPRVRQVRERYLRSVRCLRRRARGRPHAERARPAPDQARSHHPRHRVDRRPAVARIRRRSTGDRPPVARRRRWRLAARAPRDRPAGPVAVHRTDRRSSCVRAVGTGQRHLRLRTWPRRRRRGDVVAHRPRTDVLTRWAADRVRVGAHRHARRDLAGRRGWIESCPAHARARPLAGIAELVARWPSHCLRFAGVGRHL